MGPGERAVGAVFIGYRGGDGETTGGIMTVSPLRPTFVRLGAEITPRSPDGAVRLLWGIGFESPKDRTFVLDVHDWGPVHPGRGFTVRTAEATFGYKLPRVRAGPFELAAIPFAAMPFEGGPYAGAGTTLTIRRTWFVSSSVGWTLPGILPASVDPQRWRVSFALGRWDGSPGGLFVTYRDDLKDGSYRTWREADRQGRGALAVGVNWSR
jgi:hypothetical protein